MTVIVRMMVPASSRNLRVRRHATRKMLLQTGTRYGGSSSSSGRRGPLSTVRRSTAAAPRVAHTESAYIENSTTAPALTMPKTRGAPANTTAVMMA